MLKTPVRRDWGEVEAQRHVADDAIGKALRPDETDTILIVGSSGKGWNDRATETPAKAGELAWYGIALEPGRSSLIEKWSKSKGSGRTASGIG